GGLPVGTVVLVEEDFRGLYSKILLKYFLAEGLVSKHSTLIASQDVNPAKILKELPAVIESDPEPDIKQEGQAITDKMKIAFRYQNLPTSTAAPRSKHIGHHFDLSRNISFSNVDKSDIDFWTGEKLSTGKVLIVTAFNICNSNICNLFILSASFSIPFLYPTHRIASFTLRCCLKSSCVIVCVYYCLQY
ncbi:hypothetical protein D910_06047, partial [Dendroctonus ponderosae]